MEVTKSKTWWTSDTHWFHKNIMKFQEKAGTRLGADHNEMTAMLILIWNQMVSPNDTVWHLGDVSFGNQNATIAVLEQLNGNIHLIRGNHDQVVDNVAVREKFASIQEYKELKIDGITVVMSHYPFAQWNKCHHGSFMLHGHCHGSYTGGKGRRILDVGIDNRPNKDMMLWSWEEIKERLELCEDTEHGHKE